MTNQQRARKRQQAERPSSSTWLWIGVVAVVAVVGLIAILTTRDSGDADAPVDTSGGPTTTLPPQYQPVTVTGDALPAVRDFTNDPAIGTPAPVISGFSFDGSPVTIDPADGPVMVVFLAHWCPHCNNEIPVLNAWRDSGGIPPELRIIGVSTAVAENRDHYPPSEWVVKKAWTWPVLADSEGQDAAVAYGVSGFPYFAIVGQDGLVKLRMSGEQGADVIDRLVDQALAS